MASLVESIVIDVETLSLERTICLCQIRNEQQQERTMWDAYDNDSLPPLLKLMACSFSSV